MKRILVVNSLLAILVIIITVLVGKSSFAQQVHTLQLTDFAAYTSEHIDSSRGDYLGLVASSGTVTLNNFLVNPELSYSKAFDREYGIYAKGNVDLTMSTICGSQDFNCKDGRYLSVNAPSLDVVDSNVLRQNQYVNRAMFQKIENQFSLLEQKIKGWKVSREFTIQDSSSELIQCKGPLSVFKINFNGPAHSGRQIILDCNDHQDVVLVLGSNSSTIDLRKFGMKGAGRLDPKNILYFVPSSKSVILSQTGSQEQYYGKSLGLPGVFFAPHSDVFFTNALVTGAVWAKSISNGAALDRCHCQNGGQINGVFSRVVTRIIVTPPPRPTPTPCPQPTPRPTATPCPQPTPRPTATPCPQPTPRPTATPCPQPTPRPTATPYPQPTPPDQQQQQQPMPPQGQQQQQQQNP